MREDIKGGPGGTWREARSYRLASGEPSPGECVFVFVGVFTF